MEELEPVQIVIILAAYNRGLRVSTLGSQPSPWMKRGLEILEAGGELTPQKIKDINLAGGTGHPDPWFG